MAKKDRIWFVIALVLLAAFYGVWGLAECWLSNRALAQYDWDSHDNSPAAQLKLRVICHKIISCKFGNHHDAFVALIAAGDRDSIPYLINALKWHEPTDGSDIVSCTADHCHEALCKLTGMNFGYSYNDWNHWWQTEGAMLSSAELARLAAGRAAAEQ